jgi:hypothetical protein
MHFFAASVLMGFAVGAAPWDSVPEGHLPPKAMGFCHVGNLVEIGKLGKYSAIDAHRPESYLKELSDLS